MRAGLVGDKAAYAAFYRQLAPVLDAMAGAIAPAASQADRDDMVQDILLAIHAKRHTWIRTRPVLPWVYAIARYRIIDRLRALKRHADRHAEIDPGRVDAAVNAMIEQAENRLDLEKGIARLPARTGRIMTAIGRDGKSIRETSGLIGISENAVRLQLHRGIRKLRAVFAPEGKEPGEKAHGEKGHGEKGPGEKGSGEKGED